MSIAFAISVFALGPASAASAAPPPAAAEATASPSGGVAVLASPKCSGTAGHGKIRYQVCFRYNCDSGFCNTLGYLGLVNTATSARTVTWRLEKFTVDLEDPDDSGTATLAAGEQRTIYSRHPGRIPCDTVYIAELAIKYDSTGYSPEISVSDFASCVG
jgi:hypothetical protein